MKLLSATCFFAYLFLLGFAIGAPLLGGYYWIFSIVLTIVSAAYFKEIFSFCCKFMIDDDDKN